MSPSPNERLSHSGHNPLSIAALGSVAFDTIETPAGRHERLLGGSATYFAAAARHFTSVSVVSAVGDDFQPEDEAALRKLGIDTALLERRPGRTYAWHGSYGPDFANATTVAKDVGVIETYSPPSGLGEVHGGLFLGAMDPAIQRALLDSSPDAALTALDSREAWIHGSRECLAELATEVDYVFLNTFELSALTGRDSVERGAAALLDGGAGCVIVKQGADGAALYADNHALAVSAHDVVVVDPTGAGDAFAGGFTGVLASTSPTDPSRLDTALRYGAAMASCAVESFGIESLSTLSRPALDRRADSIELQGKP